MLFSLVNLLLAIANLIILGILLRGLKRVKTKDVDRPPLRLFQRFFRKAQPLESKVMETPKTKSLKSSPPLGEMAIATPAIVPDKLKEDPPDNSLDALSKQLDKTVPVFQNREKIIPEEQQADAWNIVRASVTGTRHLKNGIGCQDYNQYELLEGETVIAAVADGVGSASMAYEGAKLAVDTFLSAVKKILLDEKHPVVEEEWVNVISNGFQQAREALELEAQTKGLNLEDYATTLVAIILSKDWLITGQIGDGGIVVLVEDNQLLTISRPQKGEYVNHVFPLTRPDALEMAKFSARNLKVQAVALFTDGIQHLALNNDDDSPYPPFFTPIFTELPSIKDCEKESHLLAKYLASKRVSSRTDDDKTLLLIGRKNI
ncbi:MAG: protein phosphatase 2C domain-containing protein [Calditrichaeota bacterium]|nr:MAG: protein phosphatase 2C domain-containing protein [Calditrichota bacterium]